MSASGFLLPPWYQAEVPSVEDMKVVCIIWGFTLALAVFVFFKAVRQSWRAYKRNRLFCAYITMVWLEWLACVVLSVVCWLYLNPESPVREGFWTYVGILIAWTIQVHCILQIIINRVRLLMDDRRRASQIKWGVFAVVVLINISVWIIWVPARLQISTRWIAINEVWDRIEKVLFACIDLSLNSLFIHLVRSKMIANGLSKYDMLFRFNLCTIFLSMSLDVLLIGMMSLQDTAAYMQFDPLVYLLKLFIEMTMAELIARVVKATNELNEYAPGTRAKARPLHKRLQSTDSNIYGIFRFSISPTIVEDIETGDGRRPEMDFSAAAAAAEGSKGLAAPAPTKERVRSAPEMMGYRPPPQTGD